jgi:thiol:disulfide interchange protein DsbA
MRLPRVFGWSSLLSAAVVLTASALAQPPVADKEYKLINPPQRTETGKKIEVIEFFSYACPHCADFEPFMQDWLKRKPKDVEYRMVPMVFRESWKPLAKLFHLEQMASSTAPHEGVTPLAGPQLFNDQAVMDWALKQGIDKVSSSRSTSPSASTPRCSGPPSWAAPTACSSPRRSRSTANTGPVRRW